jgi:hypothetical protein
MVVVEFELRALCSLGWCSTSSVMAPPLFALGVFETGSHIHAQAGLDPNSCLCLPCDWDHRCVPQHAYIIG